jgi:hypothetical protein
MTKEKPFPSGQQVRIDGNRGIIEILKILASTDFEMGC